MAILAIVPYASRAQYFDLGQSPASIRWRVLETPNHKIVYPRSSEEQAARIEHYLEATRPHIGFGFGFAPMKLPILIHTENFNSNGIVLWAPKRMELIAIPPSETFAVPWLKQLTMHEYRHAVQYNALNRNTVRAIGYVTGQQAQLASLALLPIWFLEGDAVIAETQMTSFGRGRQPSFSIAYRALLDDPQWRRFSIDKWFSGSFRDEMPSHYHLGYQVVSWSYDKYGPEMWSGAAEYASKYPFLLFPKDIYLKRHYNTKPSKMTRETLEHLESFWASLPQQENSGRRVGTRITSPTTYSSPVWIDDTTVVAVKSDFDRYHRIVRIDLRSDSEQHLKYIMQPTSHLSYRDGRLYWSEYRQSTLWEQRVNSQVVYMDMESGAVHPVAGLKRNLYPTPLPDGGLATIEYDYREVYSLTDGKKRLCFDASASLHGLAYDDSTGLYYFILLSDEGMQIASSDRALDGFMVIKQPTYATISSLRADNGILYFGSIGSGRDEVHALDTRTGIEWQLTASRYGSFGPAVRGTDMVMTTYSRQGHLLARQSTDSVRKEFEPAALPADIVNPPHRQLIEFNIDTVRAEPVTATPSKRYRKALNLFNVHSWAPLSYDPDAILGESSVVVRAGVSLMSQNLLGSMVSSFSAASTGKGMQYKASMDYRGLPVKFSLNTTYGGGSQHILARYQDLPEPSADRSFFELSLTASTPLCLSSGYLSHWITPLAGLSRSNGLYPRHDLSGYVSGIDKFVLSLQYSASVRHAHRDFLPRWGYIISYSEVSEPFNSDFGRLRSYYIRGYLPGAAPHHSLRIAAAYQRQEVRMLNFAQKTIVPMGIEGGFASEKYEAVQADYQMPVAYPDSGIPSLLYIRRIRLNIGGAYAVNHNLLGGRTELYSYGCDLYFDINPFRLPENTSSTLRFSLYKPNVSSHLYFSLALGLPL